MQDVILKCPHCEQAEVHSNELVVATAYVQQWRRDEDGKLIPLYAGESRVDWESQTPDSENPYICTDCGETLKESDLVIEIVSATTTARPEEPSVTR